MKKVLIFSGFSIFMILVFVGIPNLTSAHSGGTDSSGCHHCWTNCSSYGLSYGEYHCHNSGSSYTSPTYTSPSYTATPSCPLFSSYDYASSSCRCNIGYVVDTDIFGKEKCVYGNTYCRNEYGYGSNYDSISKKCECSYGYMLVNGKCIDEDTYCQDLFGYGAEYDTLSDKCDCRYGYEFDGLKCSYKSTTAYIIDSSVNNTSCTSIYGPYSYLGSDDLCYCNLGYQWNASRTSCVKNLVCSDLVNGYKGTDGNCYCNSGYSWSDIQNKCVLNITCADLVNGYLGTDSMCYCNSGYSWVESQNKCLLNSALYQKPTTTVVVPAVINSYTGMYGRTVYTDRPDPLKIIGAMVKGESDPATYVVDTDGKLKWIKTEDVAKRLFGTAWDGYITWFSDSIIYTYKFGDAIEQ